jgi:hypothetical protein
VFERYYCETGLTDEELFARFQHAQELDRVVALEGHKAVPSFKVGPR